MAQPAQDLSFKVLNLLSRERGVYGLRNGDHERYRHHCSNKLHRLRQVTGLTSGKGKVYKKPPPLTPESVTDVRHLQLILFSAERALAHSHEFKALLGKPSAPHAARKEQISWLRRALKFSTSLYAAAQHLASASPARLSQRTLAEITIYHLSVRAELNFERVQYADVLADLAARRRLLNTLADAAKDSYDQALAAEFIDLYDPLIRFSAYKLGRAESHDIDGVVADIDADLMEEALPGLAKLVDGLRSEVGSAEIEAGRRTLDAVEFAGDKVELRNAEIVQAMLRVQEALGKLKGKSDTGKGRGMKGWDRVLGVLGDAEGLARHLVEDHENSASASLRSTRTAESLSLAHQYIVFLLLSNRIRRDLLLVDSLSASQPALSADPTVFTIPGGRAKVEEAIKSLAAIVKLYDTVLQSLNQLRNLAIVEEKDGVRRAAEGVSSYFHATKEYYLARLHTVHPTPSYASAVQLLSLAGENVAQAREALFNSDVPLQEQVVEISRDDVDSLDKRVQALDLAAKRALFAQTVTKPVFFDTAFNYIDLPMEDLLEHAGKGAPKVAPVQAQAAISTPEVVHAPVARPAAVARERTREATPQPAEAAEAPKQPQQQQKGWLGGWFGRGQ
ncbi:hypothetical protein VHUM_03528 [Vanrija humicola]|uniref:Signal recognition particle subunit SRP68 n=1 Tax=Vanrija humicola TaxID=5417 RepID=A0A7D8UYK2_VANHU|nr:hypothetical protein VHUM_03528 [Vanrija humicola]